MFVKNGSVDMGMEFTPDPAKFMRVNDLEATLCGCLFTGEVNKRCLLEMRSASRAELIRNTVRGVLRTVG